MKVNKSKRFIDDLISINSNGVISELLGEIYPVGLQPNKENISDQSATFLELNIEIKDTRFLAVRRQPYKSSCPPLRLWIGP